MSLKELELVDLEKNELNMYELRMGMDVLIDNLIKVVFLARFYEHMSLTVLNHE